jgi:phytoene synthase
VYAFCRVADDLIDLGNDVDAALATLYGRLDAIDQGRPGDDPVDRAFSWAMHRHRIPVAVPRLLLEGFAWDAQGRRYATLAELEAYCVRVASTVGVMMTLLFGERDPAVLARACDLGLAMQLTNVCRDVGEDARAGRIYLPLDWLRDEGLDPEAWQRAPAFSPALARVVARLLAAAETYYRRADFGISLLPRDCRLAVRAARLIYSDIGRVIAAGGFDSVSQRAHTSTVRKLWLVTRSLPSLFWPRRPCDEPAAPAARGLVDAVAGAAR